MKKYALLDFIIVFFLGVALVLDIIFDFSKYYRICVLFLAFVAAVVRALVYFKFLLKKNTRNTGDTSPQNPNDSETT